MRALHWTVPRQRLTHLECAFYSLPVLRLHVHEFQSTTNVGESAGLITSLMAGHGCAEHYKPTP